ncbi:MAG TPA: LysM peptidoglycan-binding domain-containing protein [Candidatus Limnocylindrales bacterium]|nr:LysM peptidoglycan-binding domain-containing protein [Candidatus Limnocylindrales bacterium]
MTDRGGAEVARVCPFVALDDDRDRRLSQPDHRHRCFAVSPPAPRAIAHQEAYCLSPSFPGCPVFQDWAQREAAAPTSRGAVPVAPVAERSGEEVRDVEDGHDEPPRPSPTPEDAIIAAGAGAAAGAAATAPPVPEEFDAVPPGPWDGWTSDPVDEPSNPPEIPRRRPGRRDWAAPPPWSGGDQAASAPPPPFLADRSDDRSSEAESDSAAASPRAFARARSEPDDVWIDRDEPPAPAGPPVVEDEYDARPPRGRSIAAGRLRDAERGETPAWERPRRSEAYPTLKTPMSLPRLGPVALGVIALIVAALFLFLVVPTLLLGGAGGLGGGGGGATATPSAAASSAPSVSPTPAAPTPTVYVIKQGDTLSKIAKKFKISIDDLIAANPSIKNPDRITLGQQIIIPTPGASVADSAEPSAAASPSG